jgi:hypothetical protein
MKKNLIGILLVFLVACSQRGVSLVPEIGTQTETSSQVPSVKASSTSTLLPSDEPIFSPTPNSTHTPGAWKSLPVIPQVVSQRMIELYRRGLARGRDASHFSKIGDCQNITPYFLSAFSDPSKYRLGANFASLQATIDHFSGSWTRKSVATHGGFNAATVLNPFWTVIPRPGDCQKGETPTACEFRLNNPSIVIISMEEAWSGNLIKYDQYMRMLVEFVLSQDVVPILATRAELPDARISINAIVVQIADDYQIPLWNFGAAAESLPNHGLSADGFHLTPGTIERGFSFDDPERMQLGWIVRNLTALQAIDAVYRALSVQP